MRFRRGICAALVIGLGGLGTIEGCSLVTGYDGFYGASATATCGARIPAPPPKSASTADMGTLVGAAQEFRFTEVDGGQKAGLDLDEYCDRFACEAKAGAKPRTIGTDNVLGFFIASLNQQADISVSAIQHGMLGLIVVLEGWNGTDSDDEVKVTLYNVAGLDGSTDGGVERANDGNDLFIPRQDDTAAPPIAKPAFTSAVAYVTKKQLVAKFDSLRVRLITPNFVDQRPMNFDLVLVDAAVVGTVVSAKGGLQMLDAQLVGRVQDKQILRVVSNLGSCNDPAGAYSTFKSAICGVIDLTDAKNTDGKQRPCTSGSIEIGLAVAPAKVSLNTPAPAPVGPYLCPNDPPDSCPR